MASGMLLGLLLLAAAARAAEKLPTFGDTIQIQGAMNRTDQDFADGLALDIISPKARTLVVKQNVKPLAGAFVTGTTGGPFVALMNYSYVLSTSDKAQDLVAKVEIPYRADVLAKMGKMPPENTYIGRLAADNKSWVVDDATRNIHRTENLTRIIKMTSLDGEYLLLGRMTEDTGNVFVQYGFGESRTVNITGGAPGGTPGRMEAEFIDGLLVSAVAPKNVRLNAQLVDAAKAVGQGSVPATMRPVQTYVWVLNSSDPTTAVQATVRFPINRVSLGANLAITPSRAAVAAVVVARKALNSPPTAPFEFVPAAMQTMSAHYLTVSNVTQLDGQWTVFAPSGP